MFHFLGRIKSPFDIRDYNLKNFIPRGIPTEIILEKNWEFPSVPLNQGETNHCFPAGTLIRMADGSSKAIEEISPLDKIISAEGNECFVYASMVKPYVGKILNIDLWGSKILRCTPDHLILTKRGYIEAEHLTKDDFVSIPRHYFSSDEFLFFADVVKDNEFSKKCKVGYISNTGMVKTIISPPLEKYKKTYSLGKLFGIYLAEGWARSYGISLAFNKNEEFTLVKEVCDLIKKEFNAEPRLQFRNSNNVIIVTLGGRHWKLFFSRLFGEGALNKRLSPLLSGSNEFRRGMLDGWIAGDGHLRRTSVSGVTISPILAHDMFCIANDIGLMPTIRMDISNKNNYAKKRFPRWTVEWGTASDISNVVSRAWRSDLDDHQSWRKVKEIVDEGIFEGFVYNLEVERDHSYIANGIGVHNCVGFSMADFGINYPTNTPYTNADGDRFYYLCKAIDGEPNNEDGSTIRSVAKAMVNNLIVDAYAFAPDMISIKWWLLNKGPIIVGTTWTDDMFNPDNSYIIRPTGNVVGGHAYLLNEWRIDNFIGIQNSWGADWGNNGKAYISSEDFEKLFVYDGEAMTAVEIPAEHPPVIPTPKKRSCLFPFLK